MSFFKSAIRQFLLLFTYASTRGYGSRLVLFKRLTKRVLHLILLAVYTLHPQTDTIHALLQRRFQLKRIMLFSCSSTKANFPGAIPLNHLLLCTF